MHVGFDDQYPTGAVGGADFFTRAAQGDLVFEGPDGPESRRERVLLTDKFLDGEDFGQVCLGERTVRHLAHELGMTDNWRVERVIEDNQALRRELVELSERLGKTDASLRFARQYELQEPPKVYLSFDGTEHASKRAAIEASAATVGLETRQLLDAQYKPTPVALPTPTEAP